MLTCSSGPGVDLFLTSSSSFPERIGDRTIFLWVLWSGPHRRSETTRWDSPDCHSRSSPHRTPGGTGSRWARSGPRACPTRQRGAQTGWCRRAQPLLCASSSLECLLLRPCGLGPGSLSFPSDLDLLEDKKDPNYFHRIH